MKCNFVIFTPLRCKGSDGHANKHSLARAFIEYTHNTNYGCTCTCR